MKHFCWALIQKINCGCHCNYQKRIWKVLRLQHTSCHLHNGTVLSFYNTIMLWGKGFPKKSLNVVHVTKISKLFGDEFPPLSILGILMEYPLYFSAIAKDSSCIEPQMSECTSSRGYFTFHDLFTGNVSYHENTLNKLFFFLNDKESSHHVLFMKPT